MTLGAVLSGIASGAEPFDDSRLREFSSSRQWQHLLHFRGHFPFGNRYSEVSESRFFISPEGATQPEAELRATLQAFRENRLIHNLQGQDVPARCAFPARWEILKKWSSLPFPEPECPGLTEYLRRLNAESLTLVFSSSYPNSPPSMFGHTFFRVNSAAGDALGDLGINYAAFADGADGGASFALNGVFGGYYGHFSIDPYYLKVNEYNHAESRDLWEYDLNLSPAEVRLILMHIWELDQLALFKYYFFDENCSYRLLTLIEVARPDWELSDFGVYVIPAETIKHITRIPGAVKRVTFRPSLRRQMNFNYRRLSEPQKRVVRNFIDRSGPFPSDGEVSALDALIDYYRYQTFRNQGVLTGPPLERYQQTLKLRSQFRDPPPRKMVETDLNASEGRPDIGHDPSQFSVTGGIGNLRDETRGFGEIGFKFAYHDLWNNDRGYARHSHVDFPQLRLRSTPKKLWIEQLGLAAVTSLVPFTPLEKRLSWSAHADYGVPKDLGCWDCHTLMLGASTGFALELLEQDRSSLLFYSLLGMQIEGGSTLGRFFRFGPEAKAALMFEALESLKFGGSSMARTDLAQSNRQKAHIQLQGDFSYGLSQNWEVRGQALRVIPMEETKGSFYTEFRLGLYKYF